MKETIQPVHALNAGIQLEFAPMEGITGYVFRQAHAAIYGGVDRYYSPFIAPGASHKLTSREKNDILPEHNQGLCLIPQVLTHSAEDFLWVCEELAEYGYETVNLNLGCPSGTVVTKKKGAGFLAEPQDLSLFLEEVCNGLEKIRTADGKAMRLSIKTRIGMKEASEFPRLLAVYNQYPLEELIVHPRVREDYYKGKTRMESFAYALEQSRCPVCYNGNLFSAKETAACVSAIDVSCRNDRFSALMFGRGAVAAPWMFEEVRNFLSAAEMRNAVAAETGRTMGALEAEETGGKMLEMGKEAEQTVPDVKSGIGTQAFTADRLRTFQEFHDRLLGGYEEIMSGDRNTLFKMKELWYYFQCHFPGCEKELKKIKKAQKISDYRAAVQAMFTIGRFVEDGFNPAL